MNIIFILSYVLLTFFVTIVSRVKYGTFYNVNLLFTALWSITGIVSSLDLLGLRVPSNEVHYLALLFCITVNVVSLIGIKRDRKKIQYSVKIDPKVNLLIKNINILALLLISPVAVKSLNVLISTGDFTAVRMLSYFDTSVSYYYSFFFRSLPSGIISGLVLIYILLFVGSGQRQKKYIIFAILNLIVITFVSSGRYLILEFLLTYIFCIGLFRVIKLSDNKKKTNRLRFLYVMIPTLFIYIITALRGRDIIKSGLTYYNGSFSFLDYILQNPTVFNLYDKMFGQMTFGVIVEPIITVLKVLGLSDAKAPSYYFNICCQKFYDIGTVESHYINANTTILYYFLRDFGVFGIFLGALILAVLLSLFYNNAKKGRNGTNLLLFLYLSNVLMNSVMTYSMFGNISFVTILVLVYIGSKIKYLKHKENPVLKEAELVKS